MAILIWSGLMLLLLYVAQRAVYAYWGMKGVAYTRSFGDAPVFAGQTLTMTETLANRKRLPLPWLRVEALLPAQLEFRNQEAHRSINRGDRLQNHASLFSVPAYTEIVRKHEVYVPQRGCYRVSSYTLTLGDAIGFDSKSTAYPADIEIVVFPRLIELRDFPLDARKYLQSVRSIVSPLMENHYHVAGVRAFRPGDSFRAVNWSATAKTGELLVHKRESMLDNDLTLLVNAELLDQTTNRRVSAQRFEEALSYAASAAQHHLAGGGKAGLIYNGAVDGSAAPVYRSAVAGGTAHLHKLLHAMARFEPTLRLSLHFLLEQLVAERKTGVHYFLITAFLDAKQEQLVGRLRQQGNTVGLLLLSAKEEWR